MILPHYDWNRSYQWNYDNPPAPVSVDLPEIPGDWTYCGLPVDSPLGVPAGPLLNGAWVLYYASLGFDVLTYKTVRSGRRECYALPNLQPVHVGDIRGSEGELQAISTMRGSWAVSFGMPSMEPPTWQDDVRRTRDQLPDGKILSVSVVGTTQPGWTLDDLAEDYAKCARWAVESGADCVETNFSCPNVSTCDGQLYQHPDDAFTVVRAVREQIGQKPLIVKIGHVRQEDLADRLLERLGPHVDGIAMTNSVAARVTAPTGLLFDGEPRGICGRATLQASLQQMQTFAEKRTTEDNPSLIGVGGVQTAEHVHAYLDAGAESVHAASHAIECPGMAISIRRNWSHDRIEACD